MVTRSILRPVLRPVTRAVSDTIRGFNPRSLFAAGEQGIWLDPSDFSTLFQDAAGTTPVTAVGQPVGLALDKRLGLALGAELVTNGGFDTNLDGWFKGLNVSASATGGEAVVTFAGAMGATHNNWFGLSGSYVVGRVYEVIFDATYVSGGGSLTVGAGYAVCQTITAASNAGVKTTYTARVSGPNVPPLSAVIAFASTGSTVWKLDNISVKEVTGNHAYQTTSASRTTLQQDSNGLYYLSFDGTDDGMATPSINFTGTNKMTVWAGVRKLSDAATMCIAELSALTGPNQGAFILFNGKVDGSAGAAFTFRSFGTAQASATTPLNYTSPASAVLTGQSDIAGDICRIRGNNDSPVTATNDQGAGNYGNYQLYIGRRGGTTLPFNGRIYQLIVRGAESNAGQIAATEAWVNGKTRAYA